MCNSFIIAGLLDLSPFPGFAHSRFFSCPSLSSRVFRRDPIYNDFALFQIIGVGGVRHHLKASGISLTHYLLLKRYQYRDFILKLVSYSIGPFWFIFLFNIIDMSLKQIMTPSLAARRRTLVRVCKEC